MGWGAGGGGPREQARPSSRLKPHARSVFPLTYDGARRRDDDYRVRVCTHPAALPPLQQLLWAPELSERRGAAPPQIYRAAGRGLLEPRPLPRRPPVRMRDAGGGGAEGCRRPGLDRRAGPLGPEAADRLYLDTRRAVVSALTIFVLGDGGGGLVASRVRLFRPRGL